MLMLAMVGCSQKTSSKLTGKWKADSVSGYAKDMQPEIYYEFTKDSMFAYGSMHGEPLDRVSMTYKIKSEEKGEATLEVVAPKSGQTGDFKITIKEDKMSLTDPGNHKYTLTKQ
jgi:hypothetical protein